MKEYLAKYKFKVVIIIFLSIILAAFEVAKGLLLKLITDTAVGDYNYSFLIVLSIVIIYTILELLFSFFYQKTIFYICTKIITNIRADILNSIIGNGTHYNNKNKMDILSILNNDIELMMNDYLLNIFLLIKLAASFLLSLIYVFSVNVILTFVILILGSVSIIIPRFFVKKSSQLKTNYLANYSVFLTQLKELLYGLETIKFYGIEHYFKINITSDNIQLEKSHANTLTFDSLLNCITSSISFLVLAINVVFAGYLSLNGYFSIGTVLAVMQIMNYIVNPLAVAPSLYAQIKSTKPIVNKIMTSIQNNDKQIYLQSLKEPIKLISVNNISYKYCNSNKFVFKNLSFNIQKGKKHIIIGKSGAGKSTLLKILEKLLPDYSGDILIDKYNFNSISPEQWYKHIAVVQQDIYIFNTSIKENICLGQDIPNSELNSILKMVGLNKLVDDLSDGILTNLGESGNKISGGEKQRISLARALIKKSEIIILDEVTSALDNVSASIIEDLILSLNKTVIVVSHKHSSNSLSQYDQIINL